jgi:3-hydroxybutyryl-CoA dehydrogenase
MGQGIAQVSALAGYDVILYDIDEAYVTQAMAQIEASIDKGVTRGKTAVATATGAKESFHRWCGSRSRVPRAGG